jgi:hypothetical protein
MALYCLISAGGSPGVTTTALGLALTWPRRVVLAECDPTHRSLLPGFLAERLRQPPGPGLLGLAMQAHHGTTIPPSALERYVISLDGDHDEPGDHGDHRTAQARVLHGIRDPRHAAQLSAVWPALATLFTTVDADVIADVGCVGGSDTPMPLLMRADLMVLVMRSTLPQVDAAQPRIEALRESLGRRPAMCLIGDGPYTSAAVRQALFDLPILGELPDAGKEARVLSDGARPHRTFRTSLLVRTIHGLGRRMRQVVEEVGPANPAQISNTQISNTQDRDAQVGGYRVRAPQVREAPVVAEPFEEMR